MNCFIPTRVNLELRETGDGAFASQSISLNSIKASNFLLKSRVKDMSRSKPLSK